MASTINVWTPGSEDPILNTGDPTVELLLRDASSGGLFGPFYVPFYLISMWRLLLAFLQCPLLHFLGALFISETVLSFSPVSFLSSFSSSFFFLFALFVVHISFLSQRGSSCRNCSFNRFDSLRPHLTVWGFLGFGFSLAVFTGGGPTAEMCSFPFVQFFW